MKIVADENVDKPIVDRLREDGHNVFFVTEDDPSSNDYSVLARSRDTDALLLTADKDFGELVYRQGLVHSGVLLIRLAGVEPEEKAERVASVFKEHGKELSVGFSVLTKHSLRIRRRVAP